VVEAEEVGEDFLVSGEAVGVAGMVGRELRSCAGFGVEGGPVFGPIAGGIDVSVGGEDGAVEFFVGEFEPSGAFVVEVGEGAFFEVGGFGGFGHEGGVADEGACFFGDVGEVVLGVEDAGESRMRARGSRSSGGLSQRSRRSLSSLAASAMRV